MVTALSATRRWPRAQALNGVAQPLVFVEVGRWPHANFEEINAGRSGVRP